MTTLLSYRARMVQSARGCKTRQQTKRDIDKHKDIGAADRTLTTTKDARSEGRGTITMRREIPNYNRTSTGEQYTTARQYMDAQRISKVDREREYWDGMIYMESKRGGKY